MEVSRYVLDSETFPLNSHSTAHHSISFHSIPALSPRAVMMREMENFSERNKITSLQFQNKYKRITHQCCQQCLKAHMLKKAKEFHLSSIAIEYISSLFSCETGHGGYYLDQGKLVQI